LRRGELCLRVGARAVAGSGYWQGSAACCADIRCGQRVLPLKQCMCSTPGIMLSAELWPYGCQLCVTPCVTARRVRLTGTLDWDTAHQTSSCQILTHLLNRHLPIILLHMHTKTTTGMRHTPHHMHTTDLRASEHQDSSLSLSLRIQTLNRLLPISPSPPCQAGTSPQAAASLRAPHTPLPDTHFHAMPCTCSQPAGSAAISISTTSHACSGSTGRAPWPLTAPPQARAAPQGGHT
jgi:hypothetical protein